MNKNDLKQELEGTQLLLTAILLQVGQFEVTNLILSEADKYVVDVRQSPNGNDVLYLRMKVKEKVKENGNSH